MSERTVATDALATLGTIIDNTQKRDAIHLAVEPVVSGGTLHPGWPVSLVEGVARRDLENPLGIVDPFLTNPVLEGQRFWLVIMPRVVTSLRHVWTHPRLPDEGAVAAIGSKADSERWLREFVAKSNCPDFHSVIEAATSRVNNGWNDINYLHFDGQDAHGDIPPEFWMHFEIYTGEKVPFDERATGFSCSC